MGFRKLFVVFQVLLISVILLAFQVAAKELVEASSARNPYDVKMQRKYVPASGAAPPGHYDPPTRG